MVSGREGWAAAVVLPVINIVSAKNETGFI